MRLAFRGDIEGLRAVAILLVICAHAGVPWLAGGFVGVDVFFVLSGYLITGLLASEFDANGRLAFGAFYARRLQRLLPALLLVTACTAVAAMVLFAPFEQLPQSIAAGAASTWTSNLYFALAKVDYFGPAADTNLFLHTWSLGVEEQFYLIWPAWMLFLLGAWRWQGRSTNHARLRRGLLATICVCLLLCMLLTFAKPQLGFYLVFSRGWQFALGGLAFLHFKDAEPSPRWSPPMGWAGLAVILASAWIVDAETPYPGYWALLPSLGTAAVLIAGGEERKGSSVGALLEVRPLQAIGRVSYAWYLWHWPVLLLGLTLVDPSNGMFVATLVGVSLLLAVASYRLLEAPVRGSQWLRSRPRIVIVGGIALMSCALAGAMAWKGHATTWANSPEQQQFAKIRSDVPAIYAMGCDEWFHTARVRICQFGPDDAENTAVLMGDSIAGQWFPAVAANFDRPGWRLLVLTKSACPMVDLPIFYERIGREYVECEQWRHAAIKLLGSLKPEVVLFSSVPTYNFTADDWQSGTSRILDAIGKVTRHVGVLAPTPVLPFDGPACLGRKQWRARTIGLERACVAKAGSGDSARVTAALATAIQSHPSARLIDLDGVICPEQRCTAERNGVVVYRDSQHLTASFVKTLGRPLGIALEAQNFLEPSIPRKK